MPPKDITQTGPLTGNQLQQQNDEFSQYFGDYKKWKSYGDLRRSGYSDDQISRIYRNAVFSNQYGVRPDYPGLIKMSPEERDEYLLNEVRASRPTQSSDEPKKETYAEAMLYQHLSSTAATNPKAILSDNNRPLNNVEAKIYNELVLREADKKFPKLNPSRPEPKSELEQGLMTVMDDFNPNIMERGLNMLQTKVVDRAKEEYILDNIIIPAQDNPMLNMTEQQFIQSLPHLSATYEKLAGSKWLPENDIDYHQLYLDNLEDINSGKLYRVQSKLDKYFGNIVEKYQPGWFEGGGDDLIHSKRQVFFEQAAAGAVENLMDFGLVPAGLVQGGWNAIVNGDNFWEEASYLPSIAHDVAHNITGDNSNAYGDSWSSAMANSGYTIGTMAVDAGLMAVPYNKFASAAMKGLSKVSTLGKASERFAQAARALESAKATKIFGTANALNFGVIEGSIDAIDVREGIIRQAEQTAMTLPEEQRAEFMQNAIAEANTAYGRTMLEESLVVNAGTLLGLGFYGSLAPTSAMSRLTPRWQANLSKSLMAGNKWQKAGLFAGRFVEGNMKLAAGELLEEFAQGLSSGINTARANYNINNYATALHYGLGAEYLANTHLGFMQGLERFTPQAWVEMDPENLTKQVLMSTLLFRGLHMPGKGKTRAQIDADNNAKIGKIWDNIRKFSPVQTGIGQIIADAKSEVFDIENSLENGFRALTQNSDVQEILQTQAALTDIGVQMQDALNRNDISSYQKLAAAYQVAQAVTLANAARKNTNFGKSYEQVLSHRANFDELDDNDKQRVLAHYLGELQVNTVKQLPQEQQIEVMKNTAQRALDLLGKATEVYDRLSNNEDLFGQDIRPLVYAEVLNELVPDVINENWSILQPSIEKVFTNSRFEEVNPEALNYVKNRYFNQSDYQSRSNALSEFMSGPVNQTFTKEDVSKAFDAVVTELEKLDPNASAIISDDYSLSQWQNDIYKEWSDLYQQIKRGEGALTKKQIAALDKVDKRYAQLGLEKKERHYAQRLDNARNNISGQVAVINEMKGSPDFGTEGTKKFIDKMDPNGEAVNLRKALAITDEADALKSVLHEISPDPTLATSLDGVIDRVSLTVTSPEELLDLSSYGGIVTNAGIASLLTSAIDRVQSIESITSPTTPPIDHTDKELTDSIVNDGSENDERPATTEGASPAPINPEDSKGSSKPESAANVEEQAKSFMERLTTISNDDNSILVSYSRKDRTVDETISLLEKSKSDLESLLATVPGDTLRELVSMELDKVNENIRLLHVTLKNKPSNKKGIRRPVLKNKYGAQLRQFKKDAIKFFNAKTPLFDSFELFIDKFWNPSYEGFEAIKDAFMSSLTPEELESDNAENIAKELFMDYFTLGSKPEIDRRGFLVIDRTRILRQLLDIDTEGLTGAMSRKDWEATLNTEVKEGLPVDSGITRNDVEAKVIVADKLTGLTKSHTLIVDDEGELTDISKVIHPKKDGTFTKPSRKKDWGTVKYSEIIDELESQYSVETNWRDYVNAALSERKVRTSQQILDDEYYQYLTSLEAKTMAFADQYLEEGYDKSMEAKVNEYLTEVESVEDEAFAEHLRELTKPMGVYIRFGNKPQTYLYYTDNPNYTTGQTMAVKGFRGTTETATIVKYGTIADFADLDEAARESNIPIKFKSLESILEETPRQAQEKLLAQADEAVKEQSNKKNKIAIQNDLRKSSQEKLSESHKQVLEVLNNDGAFTYVERGNLHEGDEIGFVIGSWDSPEGVRPVIYEVTKKTFEGASNNDPLFKGHQVIGIWDTDSVLPGSVSDEINNVRSNYAIGDYFELSKPCVVTSVDSTGVKFKNIVGKEITSETITDTNLNKILDNQDGVYGVIYDGNLSEATIITNDDGHMQVSNPNYDITRLFDPNATAEENSKRLKDKTKTATLANKVKFLIVPTPSGDTAQLDIRAIDDTIPNYLEYIKNALAGKTGEIVKDSLTSKMVELWRRNKRAKNVPSKPFSLSGLFRMNGKGIVVRYLGGKYIFSLGGETTLFELDYNMADVDSVSNSEETATNLLTSPIADGKSIVDIAYDQLVETLTNNTSPLIHAANISVPAYINNPQILQAQIADGLLYAPNAVTNQEGKIELAEASFTAYIEGTQPEKKVDTISSEIPVQSTTAETRVLSEVTNITSQMKTTSNKESSEDTLAGVSIGLIKPKKKGPAKVNSVMSNQTSSLEIKTNAEISTMPYQEAIKYADIKIDETTWNNYSGIERLQYLNCK